MLSDKPHYGKIKSSPSHLVQLLRNCYVKCQILLYKPNIFLRIIP